ncbi:MAG TPA: 30S ribosomal protein S3 [Candidatus Krumholzibacteria bacterium]|nr:30S ribosomal protein S3 [Candidatus Krumholzibacteria bacterium]HPD72059.1 30S ribosomal protein S3 [Candidatus Krumholzibacteria bacterium]HRY41008.1 30S ribosomal protein S3 [Candidatus Krumholzibacteria bacterium]
MGQKTHPIGFRLGIVKDWSSTWFNERSFADWLNEDLKVRRYVNARVGSAGIASVKIRRFRERVHVIIATSRPGVVIGRRGAQAESLRQELEKLTGKKVKLDVDEVKKPELCAPLVAEHIAVQLASRVSFRRAMKKAISTAMRMGAKGVKVRCAGRLGGAEMARVESYAEGSVPLHTLRADIDYGTATGRSQYGAIGVKVWICKGEIFPSEFKEQLRNQVARDRS